MSKATTGHITPLFPLPRAEFFGRHLVNAASSLRQRLANGCMPGRIYLAMLADQLDRLAAEARHLTDDGVTIPSPPRSRVVLWDARA